MRRLFSVPDDLMVKKETEMVVSSGVVELKKKQLRLPVIEFNCSGLEEAGLVTVNGSYKDIVEMERE